MPLIYAIADIDASSYRQHGVTVATGLPLRYAAAAIFADGHAFDTRHVDMRHTIPRQQRCHASHCRRHYFR